MKQPKDTPDPAGRHISGSFKQSYAGTGILKRQAHQDSMQARYEERDSHYEPDPLEVMMNFWSSTKNPEQANKITAIFTALIFVATAVYAIVALCQWNTMGDQLEEMRNGERAWIGPVDDPIQPQLDNTDPQNPIYSFGVTLKNTGKTPATKVRTGIYTVIIPKDQVLPDPPYYPPPPEEKGVAVLQPSATYSLFTGTSEKNALEFFPKVRSGDDLMYVYGWISYDDIYGRSRCTHFCEVYKKDLVNAWACKTYSDVDKEPCRPNGE